MPKIIDREEKKLEILEAALRAFAEKGAEKTRMTDIAEYAGIGKGTIYEYFKSKNEIFESAFHHWMEQMEGLVGAKLFRISDPKEKLRVFLTETISAFEQHAEFASIMLDFWAAGIHSDRETQVNLLKEVYGNYNRIISEFIEQGIREGIFREVDSSKLASSVIGALDGLMLQWIMFDDFPVQETAEEFINVMIKGIEKSE